MNHIIDTAAIDDLTAYIEAIAGEHSPPLQHAAPDKLYKLMSASDIKLGRRVGEFVALADITHGGEGARVTVERSARQTLLVIEYKGELYELIERELRHGA